MKRRSPSFTCKNTQCGKEFERAQSRSGRFCSEACRDARYGQLQAERDGMRRCPRGCGSWVRSHGHDCPGPMRVEDRGFRFSAVSLCKDVA